MSAIQRIQNWYQAQCDGDWEHTYGIKIDTLDNPGWSVSIDLEGTALGGLAFERVSIERSDSNWLVCRVEKKQFLADGGPQNLEEILKVFLDWAEGSLGPTPSTIRR